MACFSSPARLIYTAPETANFTLLITSHTSDRLVVVGGNKNRMASNSRGVGTIDNAITRDVLSSNSHCDLDSATVPFSGTSHTKASAAGGQRTTNRDYSRYSVFDEEKDHGVRLSTFFFVCVASPADSVPIYKLSTATQSSLFGLGFVLGSPSYRFSITSIRCQLRKFY